MPSAIGGRTVLPGIVTALARRDKKTRADLDPHGLVVSGPQRSGRALFVAFRLAALRRSLLAGLQRGAENIAERGAGIGRAILRDRLFLLGDFQRLDRDGDLAGAAVENGDPGVDLLADGEALRPLVGAVAGEFVALDEGGEIGSGDLARRYRRPSRRAPRR